MKKTDEPRKQITKKKHDLFGATELGTSLPVISDEQLSTVTGGFGPKIPRTQCD